MDLAWCDAADAVGRVPAVHGAYVLEWWFDEPVPITFGVDRTAEIGRGRVRYVGSAWGSGGLAARVTRHLDRSTRRDRWHVDALTRVWIPDRVGWSVGGCECDLVQSLLAAGWSAAAAGFGASDCRRCPAHLVAKTR